MDELKLVGIKPAANANSLKLADKVSLFMDHYSPAPTLETAALHAEQRELHRLFGCSLFPEGSGVGHQIALESIVKPGQIAIGVDSHTCTVGALGALGLRMPPVSVARALRDGAIEFFKPKIVRVELTGSLPGHCDAKDFALYLASLGPQKFQDVMIEFGGSGLKALSISDRATLANLSTDLHARGALFEVDATIATAFPDQHVVQTFADPTEYAQCVPINLDLVEPHISLPGSIFNAVPLRSLREPRRIDVVTVGSCTNGRIEDFIAFHESLSGGHFARGVRVILTPASSAILQRMNEIGLLSAFIKLGATVNPPGCGPCMGLHQGILADGEVCVATGSRNAPGRMGSTSAEIILAGPKIAGYVARTGYLVNLGVNPDH